MVAGALAELVVEHAVLLAAGLVLDDGVDVESVWWPVVGRERGGAKTGAELA